MRQKEHLKDNEIYSGIDVLQDKVNKKSLEKLGGKIKLNDGIFVINSDELNTCLLYTSDAADD